MIYKLDKPIFITSFGAYSIPTFMIGAFLILFGYFEYLFKNIHPVLSIDDNMIFDTATILLLLAFPMLIYEYNFVLRKSKSDTANRI